MPPDEIKKAHRWFAVEGNNRAWDLAAKASRTPAEDSEMLLAAYAAAYPTIGPRSAHRSTTCARK
jgi:hypothetical protein